MRRGEGSTTYPYPSYFIMSLSCLIHASPLIHFCTIERKRVRRWRQRRLLCVLFSRTIAWHHRSNSIQLRQRTLYWRKNSDNKKNRTCFPSFNLSQKKYRFKRNKMKWTIKQQHIIMKWMKWSCCCHSARAARCVRNMHSIHVCYLVSPWCNINTSIRIKNVCHSSVFWIIIAFCTNSNIIINFYGCVNPHTHSNEHGRTNMHL